ncbi:hypothetical protein M885DRAFT_515174 [Pelagophyceae sp. CCMP2097]|nr:hypothetical protein M885DRAFT_515174 [Pelagophyceae sp. CCMP2097]
MPSSQVDPDAASIKLFQYPPGVEERDSILLTKADYERMEPGEFLNDNLVDFYLKLLMTDAIESKLLDELGFNAELLKKDVHVFSSHFYTKFYEEAIGRTQASKDAAYDRVERWTRGIDIFAKKFVVVPIVRDLHWSLAIICHPGLLVDELIRIDDDDDDDDDDGDAAPERSCIIFLDSLGMHNSVKVASNLRVYLELERKKRGKVSGALAEAPVMLDHLPLVTPKAPVQENGCDCGLYLLRYFEELLPLLISSDAAKAPDVKVTRAAIESKFAAHKFADWFKPRAIARMRVDFAECIRRIEEGITGKPSLVTPPAPAPAPAAAVADDAASLDAPDASPLYAESLDASSPPDASPLDVSLPDAASTAASPPDASLDDAALSDASQPDASQPDVAQPDASPPDAASPDSPFPSAASALPDATLPVAVSPVVASPFFASPGATSHGAASPGSTAAGVPRVKRRKASAPFVNMLDEDDSADATGAPADDAPAADAPTAAPAPRWSASSVSSLTSLPAPAPAPRATSEAGPSRHTHFDDAASPQEAPRPPQEAPPSRASPAKRPAADSAASDDDAS